MRITQPKTKKEDLYEAIMSAILLLIAILIWAMIAYIS